MGDDKKYYYIAVGFILVLAFAYWLLSDVHGDGGRTADVGTALGRATGEQRRADDSLGRIERGLDDSAGRVDSIEAGITDAETAIADAHGRSERGAAILGDSAERIRRCCKIIESVRSRAQ